MTAGFEAGRAAGPGAGAARGTAGGAAAGPVLDVGGLWLRDARGRALVCGVDLRVGPGEAVGLVGESGSGKTLSARAALGLLPAGVSLEADRVRLAGTDVYAAPPGERRRLLGTRVGYVPQNTLAYLQPSLRVRTQLVDGYRTWHRGVARAEAVGRASELLASVGVDDPERVLASYPGSLSGGQRQRVNIAMALMGEPALVVADEPTAALDSVTAAQVADLLARVAAEHGAALLLISHDLGLVRARCDRVCVMYAGRCVEEGPCAQVLGDPGHPYTRGLLASVPQVGAGRSVRLADIAGSVPVDGLDAASCSFAARCPLACAACRAGVPPLAGRASGAASAPGASAEDGGHRVACLRAWEGPQESAGGPEGEGGGAR